MDNLQHTYIDACQKVGVRANTQLLAAFNLPPTDLMKLDARGNYFGSENGFKCVVAALAKAGNVEEVNFSDNYLTTENVQELVECLILHPSVRRVILRRNRLYIDSGKALLRLVKLNKRVIEVDLHDNTGGPTDNKIPDKIMGQIAREVEANLEIRNRAAKEE